MTDVDLRVSDPKADGFRVFQKRKKAEIHYLSAGTRKGMKTYNRRMKNEEIS